MTQNASHLARLLFGGWLVAGAAFAEAPAGPATDAELAACGHGKEREILGPRATKPSIKLTSMTPADSSYVTPKTLVIAELEYEIDRFEPGRYQLIAQFETVDAHTTSSGMHWAHPELQYAHGAIRFCYPLHAVWTQPNIKWPLATHFNLTRRNADGSTRVIAKTQSTRFESSEMPAAAANRATPTTAQLADREAVEQLSGFFETVPTHVNLCAEAFPGMKSILLPPLQDWQERYAGLREKSDNLYLQLTKMRMPGITQNGILIFLEGRHTALVQALKSTPDALSERNCSLMPGRFVDGTFDPAKRHPKSVEVVNRMAAR